MLGRKLFIQGSAFRNGQLNISIITMPVSSIFCGVVFIDAWHFFQPITTADLFTALSPCGRCAANYKCVVPIWGKKKKKIHTAEILSPDYTQQLEPRSAGWRHDLFLLGNGKASLKMHADNDVRRRTELCLLVKWQHFRFWSLVKCKNKEKKFWWNHQS